MRNTLLEYCPEGVTPYSRRCGTVLTVTDTATGLELWSGSVSVVDDGSDIARMRSFRAVFEAAGLFGRMSTEHGPGIPDARAADPGSIDWTGGSYQQRSVESM